MNAASGTPAHSGAIWPVLAKLSISNRTLRSGLEVEDEYRRLHGGAVSVAPYAGASEVKVLVHRISLLSGLAVFDPDNDVCMLHGPEDGARRMWGSGGPLFGVQVPASTAAEVGNPRELGVYWAVVAGWLADIATDDAAMRTLQGSRGVQRASAIRSLARLYSMAVQALEGEFAA